MKTQAGQVDGRGRVRRSATARRKLIAAYRTSGLGKAAFCRRRGVHLATFCQWLKKSSADAPAFAEVQVDASRLNAPLPATAPLVVELRSGLRLHVRDLTRLPELTAFIREVATC